MYNERLDLIREKMRLCNEELDTLENYEYSDERADRIGYHVSRLINLLSELPLVAKILPREYGLIFDYKGVEKPIQIEEMKVNDVVVGYHFVLPCLLDKREDAKIYNHTRENAKSCFLNAFESYNEKKGFEHIGKKVLITYINHFSSERLMIDNDNVDTKAFTDFITTYILDDDNPSRTELYIKGVIGTSDYTEVFVEKME